MLRESLKISAIVLLLCAVIPVSAQNADVESIMDQARINFNTQEFSTALNLLEDVLITAPNHMEAQELKINILVQQEQSKEALKDIEEYISLYPTHPEYYYLRAILSLQKQKFTKAIQDFDQAIEFEIPQSILYKVYLNRGMSHFYNQDFDLALGDFDEVTALNPKNATAYHGKGMVNYEMDLYEEAIKEFIRALKLEGENPITHFNLGMSYFRIDDNENACYHFNKSCELKHRNACRLLMMECDVNIPE